MRRRLEFFSPLILITVTASPAADWPTYRADAARSGYTAEELPRELSLRWSYKSQHAPQPAWRGPANERSAPLSTAGRMTFDRAYQVAAAGGRVFFGSSADCHVAALDAATGREVWTFCTGAPVRFAPTAWKDLVLVASDDGYLYALSADNGQVRWKHRGGPEDDFLLGNDRLVSRWPARGAPVVQGDIIYYAAGIWPSEGIYLYALDAATGKARWRNDESGSLYMPQPHGGADAYSGIAAQGYLAVAGERLLIPTGRAVPAAFSRVTGKLDYFHLQRYGHQGGADLVVANRNAGGSPAKQTEGPSHAYLNSGWLLDAKTGEAVQKLGPGVFAATPTHVLHASAMSLVAYRWTDVVTKDRRGNELKYRGLVQDFALPLRASKAAAASPKSDAKPADAKTAKAKSMPLPSLPTALIAAGSAAYVAHEQAAGEHVVTRVDLDKKELAQSIKVDAAAYGLAVAHGCLLISTDRGTIDCYSSPHSPSAETGAAKDDAKTKPAGGIRSVSATAAAEIIRLAKIADADDGFCVDLGCGDGSLAEELARRTKLRIYAVDPDEKNVAAARARLRAAGLYGLRVTVHQAALNRTPYPNQFANLVVSARSLTAGPNAVPADEALRLQRPSGGVACFGKSGEMKVAKRGALEGAGAWTHQYANPANTSCSDDKLVKGRLRLLWYRDADFEVPQRHGRAPAPLFLDGRLFHEGMNAIRAADAYNGRTLWEYALPGVLKAYHGDHLMGTSGTGSNLCAGGDSVYVRLPDRCLRLAATDGKKLAEFPTPKETAPNETGGEASRWGYLATEGGLLLGSLVDHKHVVTHAWMPADMSELFTESSTLFALDAKTGEPRWTYRAKHSIRHNAIAIGEGRVYLIDRPQAEGDRLRRRGETTDEKPSAKSTAKTGAKPEPPPEQASGVLIALDLRTGKELWRQEKDIYGTVLSFSAKHDALLMSYQPTRFKLPSEKGGRLGLFRASDGKPQWDRAAKYETRPVINDAQILAHGGAWDLRTGEPRPFALTGKSYGCGQLAASESMLFYRSATLGYFDLSSSGQGTQNFGGVRPGCWINAIPAGGLVLVPDASSGCVCSYLNQAWFALEPAR